MKRFATANDAAMRTYLRLAHESARRGMDRVFQNVEMPVGSSPARVSMALNANCECGGVTVQIHGVESYVGPPVMSVMRWMHDGYIHFETDAECAEWFHTDLAMALGVNGVTRTGQPLVSAVEEVSMPRLLLDDAEVFAALNRRVRGQDASLRLLANKVTRHVARSAPQRPVTLFAVGPTGVGKTSSALALAEVLTEMAPEGQGYQFLRLDMNEYAERHRISQLIGSPQGYLGYGDGAQLTDALMANPRTVVLFDEIEKAHSEILLALMNMMDAGRLSASAPDQSGNREVDCRKAIFIFTSNYDAQAILDEVGERKIADDQGAIDELVRRKLRENSMPPELIGRINTFLVYYPLSFQARAEIVRMAITKVAAEYELDMAAIDGDVMKFMLYSVNPGEFGARPYEYAIDNLLGNALMAAVRADLSGPLRLQREGEGFACVAIDDENQAQNTGTITAVA